MAATQFSTHPVHMHNKIVIQSARIRSKKSPLARWDWRTPLSMPYDIVRPAGNVIVPLSDGLPFGNPSTPRPYTGPIKTCQWLSLSGETSGTGAKRRDRRNQKFEVRGSMFRKPRSSDLESSRFVYPPLTQNPELRTQNFFAISPVSHVPLVSPVALVLPFRLC
jgi:hypothetical protein